VNAGVALGEVQIPLLAAVLLGACATKLVRVLRAGAADGGLGPTALFPVSLRRPAALAMCGLEFGLGVGLITTAGRAGAGPPATCARLGTGLLFLVAACALLELRASRPEVGCGCFGDFSTSPVNWRTLARPALLSAAALSTVRLAPLRPPADKAQAVALLAILVAELLLLAALSPELGEALVRLGYSEPCELRIVPAERTLTAVRRSKQWRRHAGLITADLPTDVWRELCWRFLVFPGRCGERDAEVVFGVHLRLRRPQIHAALVDAVTGRPLPWPTPQTGPLFGSLLISRINARNSDIQPERAAPAEPPLQGVRPAAPGGTVRNEAQ
jgi:hypothetical protein